MEKSLRGEEIALQKNLLEKTYKQFELFIIFNLNIIQFGKLKKIVKLV